MLKKLPNILIISIICIVPLIITPWNIDYYYHTKVIIIYTLCTIMALACVFLIDRFSNTPLEELILLSYTLWVIFSTVFSVDVRRSFLGRDLRYDGLLTSTCYTLIFLSASRYYRLSRHHIKILGLSAALICSYGIVQYFNLDPIPVDIFRGVWEKYVYSTLGNPNFLGSYIVLVLPIFIFCYTFSRRKLYLLISGVLFLTLLLTRTRGAWIGGSLAGILFILLVYINKLRFRPLIHILIIFFLITITLNFNNNHETAERFTSIITDARIVVERSSDYEQAGSTRIFIWKNCLKLIYDRPILGYGPDTFDIPFMERFGEESKKYFGSLIVDKAHNEYLQIAVSSGIPSLILYLTFLGVIIVKSLKNVNKNILIMPLLCSITGYLIQAFFNISVVSAAPVFWAFLGILSGSTRNNHNISLIIPPPTTTSP